MLWRRKADEISSEIHSAKNLDAQGFETTIFTVLTNSKNNY